MLYHPIASTSALCGTTWRLGISGMSQEIKTILIVVSATLAALFVHHSLEQAQASAGTIICPSFLIRTSRCRRMIRQAEAKLGYSRRIWIPSRPVRSW